VTRAIAKLDKRTKKHYSSTVLRLISIAAVRCVAWLCVARETAPIAFLFLSPRNATRSRNGNTDL